MLPKANPHEEAFAVPARTLSSKPTAIERKIWLPRALYAALPWFYLFAGIAALVATVYISAWFWVLPHYFLFSAACLHLSALVFRKRWLRRKESELNSKDSDRP